MAGISLLILITIPARPLLAVVGPVSSTGASHPPLDTLEPQPSFSKSDARELRDLERSLDLEPQNGEPSTRDGTTGRAFAVVSLLTALVGLATFISIIVFTASALVFWAGAALLLAGFVFGIMSLKKTPRSRGYRRGMAWAGLIISGTTILLTTLLIVALIRAFG